MSNYFRRVSQPVLTELALDYGGLTMYDRYPGQLPNLFWGGQVLQFGRYTNSGRYTITLNGTSAGAPITVATPVDFSGIPGGNRAVARLWAKYKIDQLLILMQTVPQNSSQWKEWRDEIIRLSRLYAILSPFSSFSDPGTGGGTGGGNSGGNGGAASVELEPPTVRADILALRAYPNPFNALSTLTFMVPRELGASWTTVTIYDITGRVVAVLLNARLEPGTHDIRWDGTDSLGRPLPAGGYVCRVQMEDHQSTCGITLVR